MSLDSLQLLGLISATAEAAAFTAAARMSLGDGKPVWYEPKKKKAGAATRKVNGEDAEIGCKARKDYRARRAALVRALTRDFDAFFALCDPAKGNVCLYGHPDESWEVSVPKKVPPLIPDPAVGINFTSDGMDRRHWLFRVAIYSDSWLICVAFYSALMSSLNAADRTRLFTLINDLPTVYEAVKEWLDVPDKSRIHLQRSSDGQSKNTSNMVEREEEHKVTLCGSCAEVYYDRDELWIACDFCPLWYHVECVNVTPERAEKIGKYECPVCAKRRTKHRLQKLTGFSI